MLACVRDGIRSRHGDFCLLYRAQRLGKYRVKYLPRISHHRPAWYARCAQLAVIYRVLCPRARTFSAAYVKYSSIELVILRLNPLCAGIQTGRGGTLPAIEANAARPALIDSHLRYGLILIAHGKEYTSLFFRAISPLISTRNPKAPGNSTSSMGSTWLRNRLRAKSSEALLRNQQSNQGPFLAQIFFNFGPEVS